MREADVEEHLTQSLRTAQRCPSTLRLTCRLKTVPDILLGCKLYRHFLLKTVIKNVKILCKMVKSKMVKLPDEKVTDVGGGVVEVVPEINASTRKFS